MSSSRRDAGHLGPVGQRGELELRGRRWVIKPANATQKCAYYRIQPEWRFLAAVGEIADLQSDDSAITWAREALAAKNRLTAADAKLLEDAFETRLSDLLLSSGGGHDAAQAASIEKAGSQGVDKSVLALSTPRRYRNRDHLRFVTQQPCLLCGRKFSDAHHIRFVQPRALGRKASDEFTVPLCRSHHRAVHRAGNEQAWWQTACLDPLKVARKLWKHTRTDEGRIKPDPAGTPAIASNEAAEPETPAPSTQAPI